MERLGPFRQTLSSERVLFGLGQFSAAASRGRRHNACRIRSCYHSRQQRSARQSCRSAGAAYFCNGEESHFPAAAACVEKRLHASRRFGRESLESGHAGSRREVMHDENFGEILRHELNNPLTGILGNAELLLAEIRRHNAGQLSDTGIKRLETVAALAVRMSETVRRLSQAYDSRVERVRSL